jgi:hypothetical protein
LLRALVFAADAVVPSEHRVINVSETGACLAKVNNFLLDSIVAVTIGGVEHAAADIVWLEAGFAGLKFHSPIDLEVARSRRAPGKRHAPAAGWIASLSSPYN